MSVTRHATRLGHAIDDTPVPRRACMLIGGVFLQDSLCGTNGGGWISSDS